MFLLLLNSDWDVKHCDITADVTVMSCLLFFYFLFLPLTRVLVTVVTDGFTDNRATVVLTWWLTTVPTMQHGSPEETTARTFWMKDKKRTNKDFKKKRLWELELSSCLVSQSKEDDMMMSLSLMFHGGRWFPVKAEKTFFISYWWKPSHATVQSPSSCTCRHFLFTWSFFVLVHCQIFHWIHRPVWKVKVRTCNFRDVK